MANQHIGPLPCIDQTKRRSIENQVHIVAGFLVMIGIGLAYTVYPPFIWLSVVVALGMIVSGFTNNCGLFLLISELPWNKESRP